MNDENNPADEIRAAAKHLEELASLATPGPWSGYLQPEYSRGEVFAGPWKDGYLTGSAFTWSEDAVEEYGGLPRAEDVAWLSLMGPQVAPHLAAWLRAEAARYGSAGCGRTNQLALAFAREIVSADRPPAVVVVIE